MTDAEKLIDEAARLIRNPGDQTTIFTIRVEPGKDTGIHTRAGRKVDPEQALTAAIEAMEAERAAVQGCPVHTRTPSSVIGKGGAVEAVARDNVEKGLAALERLLPVSYHNTADYAELTFGDHQTQAMTMDPDTWTALNELPNAVRAALSALPSQGWEDIATAPKDGSTITGVGLDNGTGPGRHIALVYWDADRHEPGFYDRAESAERYAYLTHWCSVQIPSLASLTKVHPE